MFYQELVELCKGLKLTVFTLIGLIAILANPAFSFDKTHHKSSDSGINFQVRIQHDKGLCSGSLLSKKIVITSKYCLGSNTTIMVYYNNIPYKVKAIHRFGAFKAVDQKFKTNKIAYEDLAIKAVDQKIRTNKTADKDLAVLELQNAVAGDNINFVKIPTITQERAAFTNKTALTLFGFWGDPHHSIFGYANEYLHTDNHASESKKIVPVTNCPKGTNDGSYFCTQTPDKSYKPLPKLETVVVLLPLKKITSITFLVLLVRQIIILDWGL
ncbi:hypothetical protein BSPWISOXPB_8576 [uncultured Gammaproteobacteria bacterium]|nr:hypothetical protein BSPWISOXPB_8576 [uncultured Gammaproteobacteria bacterium]